MTNGQHESPSGVARAVTGSGVAHNPQSPVSQTVVIDNGSLAIKSGFSGERRPASELLSVVGRIKYAPVCMLGGRGMDDQVAGAEALQKTSILRNRWPIHGTWIDQWDDVEVLWHNVFRRELKIDSKEHPLLMTAPLSLTPKDCEKMTTLIFEYFDCPAFFASDSAPLALYATGRSTGLVVDSGHCRTAALPVYEGFPLANAVHTFDIAGEDITTHLRRPLSQTYPTITDRGNGMVVQRIKEQCCYIAEDPSLTIVNKTWEEALYTLPDGQTISLGIEQFMAPEPMFSPLSGLQATVVRSIMRSDASLRNGLASNIVLVGGNTSFPGFADRLQQELVVAGDNLSLSGMEYNVVATPNPRYSAWLGGSMLSSLSTFGDMCIRASEYEEYGPVLMRRTCWGLGS